METANAIISRDAPPHLSEQALVDCDKDNSGCNGGLEDMAMRYMQGKGVWPTEEDYPYTASDDTCKDVTGSVKLLTHSVTKLKSTTALADALSKGAPAVAVDATSWKTYTGGILSDCLNNSLNHAVQAMAMDSEGNWTIRNSWGPRWGEGGFIRLAKGNTCGLAEDAS